MTFLDIHVVQTVPPANINRDDSGSPKTAVYGGVRRARVSSQSWKRAVRKAFEADPAMAPESGIRTKRLPQVIGDRLKEHRSDLAATADVIGLAAAAAVFKIKQAAPKKPKKDGAVDRPVTEYLLFLGEGQVDRIVTELLSAADQLAAAGDDFDRITEAVKPLGLSKLGITGHPAGVALFGRMVADSPDTNVEAACQVAHAISTHRLPDDQFDYFTAVDDIAEDAAETGAGMIGTIEFNSATLYRYASIDMRSLIENLDEEKSRAIDVALAFAKAFATSMPTGKRATFANHTRPDFVQITVRDDQPVSLVGAFERPVREREGGLTPPSVAALLDYQRGQDEAYGTPPVANIAIYPTWLGEQLEQTKTPAPERTPLPAALDQIRTVLEGAV